MEAFLDYIGIAAIGFVALMVIVAVWGTIMQRKGLATAGVALKEGREHTRDAMDIAERSLEICEQSLKLQEETNKLLQEISAKLSTHS